VIESRDAGERQAIRRRRAFPECGYRFTTYERVERPKLIVIRMMHKRTIYREKKTSGRLYRACEKTPVTNLQLETLVGDIEQHYIAAVIQKCSRHAWENDYGTAGTDEKRGAYVRFASRNIGVFTE